MDDPGTLGGSSVAPAAPQQQSGWGLGYDPTNTNLVPWRSTFGDDWAKSNQTDSYGALYKKGGVVPVQGVWGTNTAAGQAAPQWGEAAHDVGGFNTPGYQYGAPAAGDIQMSVNSPEMYQQQMQDAYYKAAASRLDPQWAQTQADLESKLSNMGLTRGSEAWNRELDNMTRGRTDAYGQATNQSILNSGQEAARMFGMDVAQGQFANQAQNQQEQQLMNRANLNNNALAQQQNIQYQASGAARKANAAMSAAQGAANSGAYQSMLAAQTAAQNFGLQSRQLTDAEALQSFNMAQSAGMYPYLQQNAAMGNFAPTGNPTYPGYTSAGGMGSGANNNAMINMGQLTGALGAGSLGGSLYG